MPKDASYLISRGIMAGLFLAIMGVYEVTKIAIRYENSDKLIKALQTTEKARFLTMLVMFLVGIAILVISFRFQRRKKKVN